MRGFWHSVTQCHSATSALIFRRLNHTSAKIGMADSIKVWKITPTTPNVCIIARTIPGMGGAGDEAVEGEVAAALDIACTISCMMR